MKIICMPYTHTLSHISRPLAVAIELRKRGHDVLFAGESEKIKFIKQEGFTVIPLYEPDPRVLFGNIRGGKLRFVAEEELDRMVNADRKLFAETKPDIVLSDGRFTAPISTSIAGIRHAAIVNVSSTEYRAIPYVPFFDWISQRMIPSGTNFRHLLDVVNLKLEMLLFDSVMNSFSHLCKMYGISTHVTATNCLAGKDLTLLADVPEYFPTRNLPGNYHYIGPLTWRHRSPLPLWWPPKKNKTLLYVTMGTTGTGNFFDAVYELLKKSGISAIITTGGQKEGLVTVGERIYVEDYLDGDLVMDACDLVVCHGGNGTIYQALQRGKPVLGIPTIPDQQYNMRRVSELKVGKMLTLEGFLKNPQSLLDAVALIVDNVSYYEAAERMRTVISACDPVGQGADLVLNAV